MWVTPPGFLKLRINFVILLRVLGFLSWTKQTERGTMTTLQTRRTSYMPEPHWVIAPLKNVDNGIGSAEDDSYEIPITTRNLSLRT